MQPILHVANNVLFKIKDIDSLPSPATGKTCPSKKLDSKLHLRLQGVKVSYLFIFGVFFLKNYTREMDWTSHAEKLPCFLIDKREEKVYKQSVFQRCRC